jgi:hypothetical protein
VGDYQRISPSGIAGKRAVTRSSCRQQTDQQDLFDLRPKALNHRGAPPAFQPDKPDVGGSGDRGRIQEPQVTTLSQDAAPSVSFTLAVWIEIRAILRGFSDAGTSVNSAIPSASAARTTQDEGPNK